MPRLDPPAGVREIAETLEAAGFEAWCVGGAVRDAILGRPHLDWDLATSATPAEVRKLFRRTNPIGIEFGTVQVLDRARVGHEVTTFRRDVDTDGRHAVVEFGASLDEDLARRDFTINAIAYSPRLGTVHDPFGGRRDLERRLVRAVGDPAERMKEDRLRALRALRFAARFEFTIEAATWEAIRASAPFLSRLSRERVQQELEKTMNQVRCPSVALELWRGAGALGTLIPELAAQPPEAFRAADAIGLPEATARAELASSRRLNRLATLFLGVPSPAVRRALRDLRFSNRQVSWIGDLVERCAELEPLMATAISAGLTTIPDAELRRWTARAGRTMVRDLLRVVRARWGAAPDTDRGRQRAAAGAYRRVVRIAYRDPVAIGDLAVDGNDLKDAGIAPGPGIGATLHALLELVLEDPSRNQREVLLAAARERATPGGR
jgi:tRNA nucleotidyltransferase (CCA-adding enzyme)